MPTTITILKIFNRWMTMVHQLTRLPVDVSHIVTCYLPQLSVEIDFQKVSFNGVCFELVGIDTTDDSHAYINNKAPLDVVALYSHKAKFICETQERDAFLFDSHKHRWTLLAPKIKRTIRCDEHLLYFSDDGVVSNSITGLSHANVLDICHNDSLTQFSLIKKSGVFDEDGRGVLRFDAEAVRVFTTPSSAIVFVQQKDNSFMRIGWNARGTLRIFEKHITLQSILCPLTFAVLSPHKNVLPPQKHIDFPFFFFVTRSHEIWMDQQLLGKPSDPNFRVQQCYLWYDREVNCIGMLLLNTGEFWAWNDLMEMDRDHNWDVTRPFAHMMTFTGITNVQCDDASTFSMTHMDGTISHHSWPFGAGNCLTEYSVCVPE